jgi:hypothetical protein
VPADHEHERRQRRRAGQRRRAAHDPEFTYVGQVPDAIAFAMDRKADVATLLQVGATATYTVGLIDLADPSRSTLLIPTTDLDGARDWTRVTAQVPAPAVVAGRRYRVDIVSHFNLTVGAVVDVAAEYDNVTLAIGKRTPPTFSGPVATIASGDVATVTGAVNPNGVPTGVVVEYGPTTMYGSKTKAVIAGDGLAASPFTIKVPGLTRGATYHYRVLAASADGVAMTQDGAFSVVPGAASTNTTGTGVPKATTPKAKLNAAGAVAGAIRRGGRLYVRLRCPASARTACRITATASAKVGARTVRAGTAKASAVGRGRSRLVALAGPRASRATLARARSLRVRVTIVDRAGHTARTTRTLRVGA